VAAAFRVYFVLGGLVMFTVSIGLLINFRGFGSMWESQLYTQTTELIKVTRLPWVVNPAQGRVARPFVGVFGVALGVVLILTGLFASKQ
jgi:hypothetical protein